VPLIDLVGQRAQRLEPASGLVPGWFRVVGPAGAAVMLVCSVPVKAVAEGSPATMGALVGFLVWLVLLAVLGTRIWREA
jgi:hypothetical protein